MVQIRCDVLGSGPLEVVLEPRPRLQETFKKMLANGIERFCEVGTGQNSISRLTEKTIAKRIQTFVV